MKQDPIFQYILMRNDLASLGAGKASAHAAHAANRMTWWIGQHGNQAQKRMLRTWQLECEGVGTCIVLSADEETVKWCVTEAAERAKLGCAAGIWRDPSYPSTTKRGFCLMPVDVCGWALGHKSTLAPILGDLPLMSNASWS